MPIRFEPKRRGRVFVMIGLGIAALVAAFQYSGTSSTLPMTVIFCGIAVVCFAIAGMKAHRLSKKASTK